jgi:predicted cupin superfamily sugar epimerase
LTTIYFLLRAGERSRWHIVSSDEVWHFYEGDPLELVTFDPATRVVGRARLSRDVDGGRSVQVVPAGCWQATRPLGHYGLAGCTVGPGFEFEDFRFVGDEPDHGEAFDGPLTGYRDLL